MKIFLIACLAVAVMAEADPNLIFYNGAYPAQVPLVGSPLLNSLISPVSYTSYVQPTLKIDDDEDEDVEVVGAEDDMKDDEPKQIVYSNPWATRYISPFHQVVVGPRYVAKNGEVEHIVNKREAEADPLTVINPLASFYRFPAAYPTRYVATNKATFFNPYTMDVTGKVSNDRVVANNYANRNQYFARAPGTNTVHIAKREAEAEPWTVYSNSLVGNPLFNGYPYARSFLNPVTYRTSAFVYNRPTVVYKTAELGVEGVQEGKTVADDAWQFTPNYAGKGQYVAKTPGSEHRAKRDADADPLTIYRTGVTTPFVRTGVTTPFVRTIASPVIRYNTNAINQVVSPNSYYPRTILGSPFVRYI